MGWGDFDRALVMVNPWAMNDADAILAQFDSIGTRLSTADAHLTYPDIDALYGHVNSKPFYAAMRRHVAGGDVRLAIYQANQMRVLEKKEEVRRAFPYEPREGNMRVAVHTTANPVEFNHQFTVVRKYFPSDLEAVLRTLIKAE